jgi:hypothetical protein
VPGANRGEHSRGSSRVSSLRQIGSISRLIITGTLVAASNAYAQRTPTPAWLFSGSAGFAAVSDFSGANLDLAIGYQFGSFGIVARGDATMHGAQTDDSRYYWDSSVDRCRDSQTGQFARSALCQGGVDARYGFMGEAFVSFAKMRSPLIIGVGYRLGDAATPYGMVTYYWPFRRSTAIYYFEPPLVTAIFKQSSVPLCSTSLRNAILR